eukprot:GILJ01000928.1.p1 GENE.GILJ01000928.1~~GILJ01000928.1.p1  ORF type:complete len:339 (+),score=45.92 GILJ01000928.1:45-1061(+)
MSVKTPLRRSASEKVVSYLPGTDVPHKAMFVLCFCIGLGLFLYSFATNVQKHMENVAVPSQRDVVEYPQTFPIFAALFAGAGLSLSVVANHVVGATITQLTCPLVVPPIFNCFQAYVSPFSAKEYPSVTDPSVESLTLGIVMPNVSLSFMYTVVDRAGIDLIDPNTTAQSNLNQISALSPSASGVYDVTTTFYEWANGTRRYSFNSPPVQGTPCLVDDTGTYCNITYTGFKLQFRVTGIKEYVDYTVMDLFASCSGILSLIVAVMTFLFPNVPPPGIKFKRKFRFENAGLRRQRTYVDLVSPGTGKWSANMDSPSPSPMAATDQGASWSKMPVGPTEE